ncbi:tetratricopeptide repeat-containing sensor histidine kinase [Chondrinema litorale]|uniref:tetratricopeptide repeat-containing sensor histidine kinase n=1 Tax=Chondrinema litorale TaxID=2994555 RepID=UPI002542DBCA|nr:tetratricopeptide repeat-containing sensor histidine kinase [Chondrinema litorale]UZR93924.1 tetratricopeptide repeat-containing sensor histidine kinase [Chondrinema litorale]
MLRRSLILLFLLTFTQLKAAKFFNQEDNGASLTDIQTREVDSLNLLSKKYKIYNKDSSLYFAKNALKIAISIEYINGLISAQHNIGEYYLDDGNYDSALLIFEAADKNAKKYRLEYLDCLSQSKTAIVYYFIGEYEKSLDILLSEEINNVLQRENKTEYANIQNMVSYIYSKRGELKKSLIYRYRALNTRLEIGDKNEIAKSYNAFGIFYEQQGNYYKALQYYIDSYRTSKEINNSKGVGISLHNIASIYYNLGNYEKALSYHKEALSIKEKLGSHKEIGISIKNMGLVYGALNKYDTAINFLNQGLKIFGKGDNKSLYGETLYDLGKVYFNEGKYDSTLYYWKQTEKLASDINNNTLLLQTYEGLTNLCIETNNDEDLIRYFKKYKAIKDSLDLTATSSEILELQARFEEENFQGKIDEVELEKRKKEQELADIEKQRFYLVLLVGMAFISIIFIYLFYKRSRVASEKLQLQNQIINNQNDHLKKLNNKLEQSKEELEKINATKDKLFAIISHDARSPLNSLNGMLQLVVDQVDLLGKDEIKSIFQKLKTRVDTVDNFLNHLLEWARLQNEDINIKPVVFSIKEKVQEVVDLYKPQAGKKNINLLHNIDLDIQVFYDPNMLDFIVRNFIANAIKFTYENGTILLSVTQKESYLELNVQDNGIGMSEAELKSLFDLKAQVSKKGTFSEKGTGLGLILCKEFIEKNNGKLFVSSTPENGTVFSFTIPYA